MEFKTEILKEKHLEKGFLETLKNIHQEEFDLKKSKKIFSEIKKDKNHIISVAVNKEGEVVGAATLIIEQKFTNNFEKWGHLEDVVTRKGFEGQGVGRAVVNAITDIAKKENCARIMLSCQNNKMKFYEHCGYIKNSNSMKNIL